jgi:protein subunit release factor B
MKNLLFSVTKKNLKITYFNPGKKGGQHANKNATACRIQHPDSGAIAECKSYKSRKQNEREALKRLTETKKFKSWLRLECAVREEGYRDAQHKVDEMMKPGNLKIETFERK